ncbi:type I glyceraldehyde-3-phosphate dehydrogenase [Amphritea sp. 2_MG-2023]|uniref:type I glyceraldehyde-3-phosphate dehydrogenase n=1 Tax=Amphritea TaxID=515417 RepID=UPI001C07A4EC|nr:MULTISPECIES: type I glyceraldehyde-3-phosphate dehydrogenase [Amphritea]MBU2966703.1 type I glyceraldehyde-3-phosphate dehydrogenase [Amphritea atlantica]MDO6417438.1 type I glyceraldehyde-3-phosphate dehydrogenase [Amphritea sp. 2_MG-2023]
MPIRVAINGYGRIGRNILRALYESGKNSQIKIIAINDLGDSKVNAHLTEFDSVHGHFNHPVSAEGDLMRVAGDDIKIISEADPHALPWAELNIDIVYECTGHFTSRETASVHLDQGAKRVLVSAPAKNADATIVYGVNHGILKPEHKVISNASCTTNCLAPVAKTLNDNIGITEGIMTTIHAYTNDQHLLDVYSNDIYRARAAGLSMIPTRTGAAEAVGIVMPELKGKLTGLAVRVPTANVSLVDLCFRPGRKTSVEEINQLMREASQGSLKNILEYNELPLVSVDFNHHSASSIFDSNQTHVMDGLVKVFAWYDNEWGFSNRMLDTTLEIFRDQ